MPNSGKIFGQITEFGKKSLSLQADIQPDIIVINGQRYWMQTLSRFSNKKGYSIRTSPNHSAIISCRKEGQNIQWYFTNASVDKNRPLTLY